jgi:glycine C-acetyltransferase
VGTPVNERLREEVTAELDGLRAANTYKTFLTLRSPQGPVVEMEGRGEVLVLSSNNYLGLAAHPAVIEATKDGLDRYGAGTASVRFICGTFEPHHELEAALAELVGTEAALTYASCWNANEAVIPSLTDENTVLISDELNHASIVDAMRLAKPARKVVFAHSDMGELREALRACDRSQRKLVVTDGVFSMEGDVARLPEIVELAREHDAIVIVDDSHGTGVMGATGRGVAEHFGLLGEIDVITSTLGKALGGASGGFVASSREVCDLLAQRSRPQLFSNAIPPPVACGALAAVRVLQSEPALVDRLHASTSTFRVQLAEIGFQPLPGEGAIIPIIVGETAFAIELSRRLLDEGVFVTGFGYPVVPEGTARIRVQMSAALEPEHLDRSLAAFEKVGHEAGLLVA